MRKLVSCCSLGVTENGELAEGVCPRCGRRGRPVSPFTISVMVRDDEIYLHPERLPSTKYFLCESKPCNTVYFDSSGKFIVDKSGLRLKVWQKEDDPEVPACYCFHNTVSSMRKEILDKGGTDVVARIRKEVKAGNCRCEVANPQGSCCLGNVVKAVEIAKNGVGIPLAPLGKAKQSSASRRDEK